MKKRIVLIATPAVVVASLGAGTAYAYFSSSGSGTGSASTGSMQTVTVAASTGTPSTPLEPGGSGDVTLSVTNPNDFDVTLVGVTSSGTVTADSGHSGCTTTGVSFVSPTGLSMAIPADGTTQVDLPAAATMSAASSSGCQGATFSIPVTIVVHK
jgi:hypothetical protein